MPRDDITVVFGHNILKINGSKVNEKNRLIPLELNGDVPFNVYIKNGSLVADAHLFGGPGYPAMEMVANKISVNNGTWDSNHTDRAIEVVVSDGDPVFQMIRHGYRKIETNAIIPSPNGTVFMVTPTDIRVRRGANISIRNILKPLFKYPSWKFMGVYAE